MTRPVGGERRKEIICVMGSAKVPVMRDRCGDACDRELTITTYGYRVFVSGTRGR